MSACIGSVLSSRSKGGRKCSARFATTGGIPAANVFKFTVRYRALRSIVLESLRFTPDPFTTRIEYTR